MLYVHIYIYKLYNIYLYIMSSSTSYCVMLQAYRLDICSRARRVYQLAFTR